MSKENFITSLKNTMELKKLIIDNPDLPLKPKEMIKWITDQIVKVVNFMVILCLLLKAVIIVI